MRRFSERIGKRSSKVEIQLESMDKDLKNGLWNVLNMYFIQPMQNYSVWLDGVYKKLIQEIWFYHFKEPIDLISTDTHNVAMEIRKRFFNWEYLDVYDFIDFISSLKAVPFDLEAYRNACNFILKTELSGYRFVDGSLAPITNNQEILSIENAISDSTEKGLKGVSIHLKEALIKLSDKKNPDYRNSIKESISAVESLCQRITGDSKAELGKALKVIKNKIPIHTALEQGFIKIYGYTSDGDGIRHAMTDEPSLDQEDALYMLISCSAFINYLITKSQKAGLSFKETN